MRILSAFVLILSLTACSQTAQTTGNPAQTRALNVADGAICPDPDPARDGPLVDAIRRDDATPVDAVLAGSPGDARAMAALAIISGRGAPDPAQAACFAPYLNG